MAKTFRPRPAKGKVNAYTDFENWASDVQSNINLVESEASAAQTTANSGVSKADVAQSTANAAQSAANAAQTTANTGVTNAGVAKGRADAAYILAEDNSMEVSSMWAALNSTMALNGSLGQTSLDNFSTIGVFYQGVTSDATTARKYPVNRPGILVVTPHTSGNTLQEYTYELSGKLNSYRRWKWSGAWQDWEKVATDADIAAALAASFPIRGTLGVVDLNTVTLPGIYRREDVRAGSANFPAPDAGILEVLHTVGSAVMQRFTPHGGISTRGSGFYLRGVTSGAWSAWRFFPSQRVDQSAGRAIYTWDDLNNREQLIYGDTGWRDITSLLINGWTATQAKMRRFGPKVTIKIRGLTAAGATAAGLLPSNIAGFKSPTVTTESGVILTGAENVVAYRASLNLEIPTFATYGINTRWVTVEWVTDDAWPTELPGTPIGSIPNL